MAESTAHPAPVTRLLNWARVDRNDITLVWVYAVASSLVALVIPITVQALVNTAAFGAVMQPLVVLALLVFVALAAYALFRALQAQVVESIQERLFARTALQLSHRLPQVDAAALDGAHGPELVNRFFDVLTIQKAAAGLLVDGSALALQTLVGMAVLGFYHPFLLAFDVLLVLAMATILLWLGRGAERTAIVESKYKYKMASWLQELTRHRVVFKGTGGEQLAARHTFELAQNYLNARRAHFKVLFRQIVGALALQVVFSSLLIATGGFLVLQKQLTLGQLVAAELIVSGVLASFSKVGKQLESLYDLLAAFDKIGHVLDLPLEQGGQWTLPDADGTPARLAVHDLSFSYQGRRILEQASLAIAPGERVALVGSNGAGKSTLMSLFYGLRRPTHGLIELDGEPLHTLTLASLRSQVAMVSGLELFEGTVLDNLLAGRPQLSALDAREALEKVQLWDEIKSWPLGLDTVLSSRGKGLSSGQARKLVLARAIAGAPRLLLLDESLDDLDQDSRESLCRYVLSKDRPWTVILVTHDPCTLAHCDRAFMLEEGRFVEVEPTRALEARRPS